MTDFDISLKKPFTCQLPTRRKDTAQRYARTENIPLKDEREMGNVSTTTTTTKKKKTKKKSEGEEKDDTEVKMVVLLHRHGARFPNSCMPNDLSWPTVKQFWDNYGANLTPLGSVQALDLGRKLHEKYKDTALMRGLSDCTIGEHVEVHTSNKHRTLFTAWNLLRGAFPNVPIYLNYMNDRPDLDTSRVETSMRKKGRTLGIPINVESQEKNDELLHQIKTAPKAVQKRKKVEVLKCAFLESAAKTKAYADLADKLYEMTHEEAFAPTLPLIERLSKAKKIANQLSIARAHGMALLPNEKCLSLTEEEEEMVMKCARCYWRYMYRPARSDRVSDGIGKAGAGHLSGEIARLLSDHVDGTDRRARFVEYSAHDTTVLAMASVLGLDIVRPNFTGYFLFELRQKSTSSSSSPKTKEMDDWRVAVYYNDDPTCASSIKRVRSRALPLDGIYREWTSLPYGSVKAADLIDTLKCEGQMKSSKILRILADLTESIETKRLKWEEVISMGKDLDASSRKEFKDAFDFYDSNHDHTIEKSELSTVFRKLKITHLNNREVADLVSFFDHSGDGSLEFEEFLSMMRVIERAKEPRAISTKTSEVRPGETPPARLV